MKGFLGPTYSSSVLTVPKIYIYQLNKEIFEVIWNYRQEKIKRSVLCKETNECGIKATDFSEHNKALKLSRFPRFFSDSRSSRKLSAGEVSLLQCDYDLSKLNKSITTFTLLSAWCEVNVDEKLDPCHDLIWNNHHILLGSKSLLK